MSRTIFQFHWYREPDERVLAWMRANNLDPHLIPVDSQAIMEDRSLTVTEITGKQSAMARGWRLSKERSPYCRNLRIMDSRGC